MAPRRRRMEATAFVRGLPAWRLTSEGSVKNLSLFLLVRRKSDLVRWKSDYARCTPNRGFRESSRFPTSGFFYGRAAATVW
jgi:hypothetical protein